MARQDLTVVVAPGFYLSAGALLVWVAADTVNFEQFPLTGPHLILAWNTGVSPYTVTINSTVDPFQRTKDVDAESVAAGDIRAFMVKPLGWVQSDGMCYLEANNVAVEFAVIKLPG